MAWNKLDKVFLYVAILVLVLVAYTPMASAYQHEIDVLLGFNIIDIIAEQELEYDGKDASGDGEGDLAFDMSANLGVIYLYKVKRFGIGGEIFYQSGDGEMKKAKLKIDGNDYDIDKDKFEFKYWRIGPHARYYFKMSNSKIKPFIGGALAYAKFNFEPDDADEDTDIGMVNLGFEGGCLYRVHKNVLIGGAGRLDYFHTIQEGSFDDIAQDGDELKIKPKWAPLSIFFDVAFTF